VLANVLENAIRFSPAGTPVSIGAGAADGEVLIRVEDEGPGVPPHELERVFEPFRHASTGDGKGTGLGLAIARGFAEANGGRLFVEPRAGGGASFVLALPAAAYPAAIPV
jgi:two-component system sensor histidine kinase KdpD